MIRGSVTAESDNHWMVLTFRDSRQADQEVKFIYYWPETASSPEYKRVLWLGEQVLSGGRQEKAFLGLLQRWNRGDGEAQELYRQAQRGEFSSSEDPLAFLSLSEQKRAKIIAGSFLKVLHARQVDPENR